MKWINQNLLKLDKILNDLDLFVLDFCEILNKKNQDYVLISGYVALLFGRSRGTEDIDLFLKPCSKEQWINLYNELIKNDFWCLNSEGADESYIYLQDKIALRFAKKEQVIPNMEIKFSFDKKAVETMRDRLFVNTTKGTLAISNIERQIAYKKIFLASPKDLEDAQFLEEIFKDTIDFKKLKELIERFENEKNAEFSR